MQKNTNKHVGNEIKWYTTWQAAWRKSNNSWHSVRRNADKCSVYLLIVGTPMRRYANI